jgi:DNA-binding transcriptional LysR family regulator
VLLEYGSRLIRLADEAAGAVADLREARSGRVVIGANEGGVHAVLPLIAAFRRDHPAILVEVRRLSARQMPQEVSLRAVDFGVVTFNPPDRELASLIVTTDELVLLVRPDHPLADRRQITMEEMGRQTVIAHNDPSPTRERVLKLYEQRQTQLNIRLSLPSLDAIKRAVEMGLGVALLPRRCAQGEISRGELVEIRVPELRSPRQVRLVHRREAQLSHAARAFLEVARREVGTDQVRS